MSPFFLKVLSSKNTASSQVMGRAFVLFDLMHFLAEVGLNVSPTGLILLAKVRCG